MLTRFGRNETHHHAKFFSKLVYLQSRDIAIFQFLPREAMLSEVYAVVVCVCLSVKLRYCMKMVKCRITQTTPHNSAMTLVF